MYSTSLLVLRKYLKFILKPCGILWTFLLLLQYMMMKNVKIDIYVQHVICFVYEIVLKGKNKNAFLLSFCMFPLPPTLLYSSFFDDLLILLLYEGKRVLGIRIENVQASKRGRSSKNFWETQKFLVSCLKMKWNCLYAINIH